MSRFTIAPPPDASLTSYGVLADEAGVLALSPDGTHLVYAASRGADRQLHLRALDQLESRPIPGTDGTFFRFFSLGQSDAAERPERAFELT